ncbi:hypothetical protein Tco_1271460, partial [Tanacetum coccineum]
QSVLYGMADMHDRHRDMRLDTMSYEELLALEERIRNVNTGLTEENISKCMKQKIYVTEDGQPLNLAVYVRKSTRMEMISSQMDEPQSMETQENVGQEVEEVFNKSKTWPHGAHLNCSRLSDCAIFVHFRLKQPGKYAAKVAI